MDTINIAIVKDYLSDNYVHWIQAIEESNYNIEYDILDITSSDFIKALTNKKYDLVLVRPPSHSLKLKTLYDEMIYIISEELKINTYPSFRACLYYENKRILNYVLNAFSVPHPKTKIFYSKHEAIEYLDLTKYPIVGKTIIGAGGLGVKILRSKEEAILYINKCFGRGIRSKTGPDFRKSNIMKRFKRAITNFDYLKNRIDIYWEVYKQRQSGFVYLQEYIPHTYEWRCVRIGESYFAHKKLVQDGMASGSLKKLYEQPPECLLSFVKQVSEELDIDSAAFDIFETDKGKYYINEIQTIFGQAESNLMVIKDKPGRYIYSDNRWVFEEGFFNSNKSYNLRLNHSINKLGFKYK